MNPEMMEALQALAADRGISVDSLFAALADALESAYKRMPGAHEFSWVTIDPETMDIRVLAQDLDEEGEDGEDTGELFLCGTDPREKCSVPDVFDNDRVCDNQDEDDDGDSVLDVDDPFPYDPNESRDSD